MLDEKMYKTIKTSNNIRQNANIELEYFNFDFNNIIDPQSMKRLQKPDANFIKSLIKTAERNSVDKPITYNDLLLDVHEWERQVKETVDLCPRVIKITDATYNATKDSKQNTCKQCEERYQSIVNSSIPLSYAIFGALFLVLSCIMGCLVTLGIGLGIYLMNPWYAILLFVGSLVLLLTDIRAIMEWRKIVNGKT